MHRQGFLRLLQAGEIKSRAQPPVEGGGQGLDAIVTIATYPGGEVVDSVPVDAASGGAFAVSLPYGDYSFTAVAVDHFEETQLVTVGGEPQELHFELGGLLISYPIAEDFEAGPNKALMWTTDQNILVRMEMLPPVDMPELRFTMRLADLETGPQDAALFESPGGCVDISDPTQR